MIHNGRPYHAIFIRAPLIESVSGQTQILATLEDGSIVAAREGHWLATSFHPELTEDDRFHRYFLDIASNCHDLILEETFQKRGLRIRKPL